MLLYLPYGIYSLLFLHANFVTMCCGYTNIHAYYYTFYSAEYISETNQMNRGVNIIKTFVLPGLP